MKKKYEILSSAKKIAVVRTDRLGDMVLTLPLVAAIKNKFPNAAITVIARKYVEPLLIASYALTDYLFIDDFKNGIKDILKKFKFDAVFFPRPRFDEALSAYNSNIALRVGSGFRAYSIFYNHRVYQHRKNSELHEAEHNLNLLSSITNEHYNVNLVKPHIDKNSLAFVHNLLNENGIDNNDTFIIIHPGSGGSAYEWSADNFGKVANIIHNQTKYKIIITGIESEIEKCNIVQQNCSGSINLCAKMNLSELIAIISLSKLMIANSTGVLHIAASLNTPVVGLYPNTLHLSKKRWGPYSKNNVVLSPVIKYSKKYEDDMSTILIDDVVNASLSLLQKS